MLGSSAMHCVASSWASAPSILFVIALSLASSGCSEKVEPSVELAQGPRPASSASAAAEWAEYMGAPAEALGGAPIPNAPSPHVSGPGASGPLPVHRGSVTETMDASGYTYVKLSGPHGEVWTAARQTGVKVGDEVSFTGGMTMSNFHSKTLDRTFDVIYFVDALSINGQPVAEGGATAGSTSSSDGAGSTPPIELGKISKAKGGLRVAEVFERKASLAGKEVSIRARVVKSNANILDRTWLHLQDGTGAEGSNDLTVTTMATANVGDLVLIKGKLALDKDFGAGYRYPLIVEDASVTVE